MSSGGGRYDFDDGGTYCGGWEDGKAHGQGVCTGPKGMGEYSGSWQYGFEHSGVYTWPSGNTFEGEWLQGKRNGLGVETKDRWVYKGEWTAGFKGRYGVRQSTSSGAKYEGTWTTGMQDGYGVETYADGGTYQGQWLRGMRHGYGVRQSVPYGLASHYRPKQVRDSLTSLRSEAEDDRIVKERDKKLDESRGGFVLKAKSDEEPTARRKSIFDKQGRSTLKKSFLSGLKLRKQKSTGDINESPQRRPGRPTGSMRSTISNISGISANSMQSATTDASMKTGDQDSNLSFISMDDIVDINVTESYMGEWKNDKRSGFGISERTDGLRYEGEWYNNKKYGYGVTTFKEGHKEEGKYKNNVLISSGKKNKLFVRSSKMKERVENAVMGARRAAQLALQKADIAVSRMANARAKAEAAEYAALQAKQDSDVARIKAKEYAPEFHQPGTDILRKRLKENNGDTGALYPTPVMNHNPHHRSKSVMNRSSPRESPASMRKASLYSVGNKGVTVSALSTALDCAIAGGSSKIVTDLNRLENNPKSNHVNKGESNHRDAPFLDVAYHGQPHQEAVGGSVDRVLNQSPSIRNRHGVTRYSARGRYHDLTNSTLLNDHFDQYATRQLEGRDLYEPPHSHASDTPDSGVSDSFESDDSKHPRPLQRRTSLPCIIRRGTPKQRPPESVIENTMHLSSESLTPDKSETYIIENGIRKRVCAETNVTPRRQSSEEADLPKRYRMENNKIGNRGSLPDITACEELKKDVMPRAEVAKLSHKRRLELIHEREAAERRKEQQLVLNLHDVKDWCQQRQLMMLVIALNVSLATMFFNLLT